VRVVEGLRLGVGVGLGVGGRERRDDGGEDDGHEGGAHLGIVFSWGLVEYPSRWAAAFASSHSFLPKILHGSYITAYDLQTTTYGYNLRDIAGKTDHSLEFAGAASDVDPETSLAEPCKLIGQGRAKLKAVAQSWGATELRRLNIEGGLEASRPLLDIAVRRVGAASNLVR